MTDLLLHNIEEQKQISEKHLLFYDNIVFFLKQYLSLKKSINNYNTDPLIRPSKAFKIYAMEEKHEIHCMGKMERSIFRL
jgi:hypothetical protein